MLIFFYTLVVLVKTYSMMWYLYQFCFARRNHNIIWKSTSLSHFFLRNGQLQVFHLILCIFNSFAKVIVSKCTRSLRSSQNSMVYARQNCKNMALFCQYPSHYVFFLAYSIKYCKKQSMHSNLSESICTGLTLALQILTDCSALFLEVSVWVLMFHITD